MWQWQEIGSGGRTELFCDADALKRYVSENLASTCSELKVVRQDEHRDVWSVITSARAVGRWSFAMPLRGLLASRWRLAQVASMTDARFAERLRTLLEAAVSAGLYSPEIAERLSELASEAILAQHQASCTTAEAPQGRRTQEHRR